MTQGPLPRVLQEGKSECPGKTEVTVGSESVTEVPSRRLCCILLVRSKAHILRTLEGRGFHEGVTPWGWGDWGVFESVHQRLQGPTQVPLPLLRSGEDPTWGQFGDAPRWLRGLIRLSAFRCYSFHCLLQV